MKTLFITGGHGEIGRSIARKFSAKGFKVISPGRRELNLANPENIRAYFKNGVPKIDVFIYCAGVNEPATMAALNDDDLLETLRINSLSFAHLAKIFSPQMQRGKLKHVLAISSLWSEYSRPGRGAYAASKHALNGFMRTLALESGKFNVKVNCLSPGFLNKPLPKANISGQTLKSLKKQIALGRLARPEEIANAAYFLCSPENSYISGQNIVADGGLTAGYSF